MKAVNIKKLEQILIMLQLSGIFVLLLLAFYFEIVLQELPCPLCLLQRVGFFAAALGFLMNLRFGLKPSHYAMAICGALFTSFVALRQIALHVIPGLTSGFGSAVLGWHLYTWSFVISMLVVVGTTIMMGFDEQYKASNGHTKGILVNIFFLAAVLLIIVNLVSMLLNWNF